MDEDAFPPGEEHFADDQFDEDLMRELETRLVRKPSLAGGPWHCRVTLYRAATRRATEPR